MNDTGPLSAGEYVIPYGPRNVTLYGGWMSSPDGRGTIDIIWSCVLTIFLSSWSILCLNLPAEEDGWWRRARRKFQWTSLTVMGPEVIFQLSLGEWLVARRSYKEFQGLEHYDWTMSHSFYANMGGVTLHTKDEGSFPVNAAQILYLMRKDYIRYPSLDRRAIQDKNKAEPVVRALTLVQIVWFLVQCMGRAIQGLALTTLELSTIAFISSAIGTFFCWFHKPMDIETPTIIYLDTPISVVQAEGGYAEDQWSRTPLDFIDRRHEWPWNVYWRWGLAVMEKRLGMSALILQPRRRPVERVSDDYWPEPTLKSLPALFFFHGVYVAILMAGWNLDLPTYTESILWRVASCIQLGTIISGWFTIPLQLHETPKGLHKVFSFVDSKREKVKLRRQHRRDTMVRRETWYGNNKVIEAATARMEEARTLISEDPEWTVSLRLLALYQTTWLIYLFARLYVVVEDVVSLRAMPPSAFSTVEWNAFVPHI